MVRISSLAKGVNETSRVDQRLIRLLQVNTAKLTSFTNEVPHEPCYKFYRIVTKHVRYSNTFDTVIKAKEVYRPHWTEAGAQYNRL